MGEFLRCSATRWMTARQGPLGSGVSDQELLAQGGSVPEAAQPVIPVLLRPCRMRAARLDGFRNSRRRRLSVLVCIVGGFGAESADQLETTRRSRWS